MAFDEELANRLRKIFLGREEVVEKKAFGGITFMLNGNMCCGIVKRTLMARVGPDQYQSALSQPYTKEMDFTGRPMKGFVFVSPEGIQTKNDLEKWVNLCEKFVRSLQSK